MAVLKKVLEKIIRIVYNLLGLLTASNFISFCVGKIPPLDQFVTEFCAGEGKPAEWARWLAGFQEKHAKYLIAEAGAFVVLMLCEKLIASGWNALFKLIYEKRDSFIFAPTRDYDFHAIYRVSAPSKASACKTDIFAIPGKSYDLEDISEDSNAKKFADGLKISVHSGNDVLVYCDKSNAQAITLGESFKQIGDTDPKKYMKQLSETHKVPKRANTPFHLASRLPFCKTFENTWIRVPMEEQLWRAEYGGNEYYFLLKDNLGSYQASCVFPVDADIEVKKVIRNSVQGNKSRLKGFTLECMKDKVNTISIELHVDDRFYKKDLLNGRHKQPLVSGSDQYPCIVVGLLGAVGCGKTTFLAALTDVTVKGKLKTLTGYDCPSDKLSVETIKRTLIEEQNCMGFAIMDGNVIRYMIYFLDLSGEITKISMDAPYERKKVLYSIGELCDVFIEFFDDRSLWGEERDGDVGNAFANFNTVRSIENIDHICICTKADKIKKRIPSAPITDGAERVPVFAEDSFVFESVCDQVLNKGMAANLSMYTHMALTKEILKGAVNGSLLRSRDQMQEKCFMVSAGSSVKKSDGTITVNTEDSCNCELVLAYLLQLKFGISLKNDKEIDNA